MVISDYISGNFVDRVFNQPNLYSGFENLMAVYGYTIQIYCDFSGYTDIAIGLALLMGYHLPLNFRSPYKSESITDFWRRWHISLSSWLKDYLYISLGGNRKGKFRQYLNLFLTMLIGGLWHGANLRFILWGGLHGLALAFHKGWMAIFPSKEEKSSIFSKLIFGILTFHFVAFCWIFFRAPSSDIAFQVLDRIGNHFDTALIMDVLYGYRKVFLVILLGYVLHLLPDDWTIRLQEKVTNISIFILAPIIAIFVILVYQAISGAIQPFIYFQF
jgi:D-alanyl-lipoteichoic acid acyltransferase DltB (MBOAT superfamily)